MQKKLSHFQVILLIYMTQSGVVFFSLPGLAARHFGTNGWIAVVLLSVAVSFNLILFAVLHRLGKGQSIFDVMEQSIPKVVLYPFYFVFIIVWVMIASLVTKDYVIVYQMISFPTTNPMILKLAVDALVFYLIIQGIHNIAKAAIVTFWLTFWMILLMFFFYKDFEFVRMTPFVFRDSEISLRSFADLYVAFSGYELCLFLFPFSNSKTKLIKAVWIGHLLTTFTYVYVCFIAFGFYNYSQLKILQFPLLKLLGYIRTPLIEAPETVLVGFFMLSIVLTAVMFGWSAKEAGIRMFPIGGRLMTLLFLLLAYCISFFLDTLNKVRQWLSYFVYVELFVSILLPIGLIILLLVQKRRSGRTNE